MTSLPGFPVQQCQVVADGAPYVLTLPNSHWMPGNPIRIGRMAYISCMPQGCYRKWCPWGESSTFLPLCLQLRGQPSNILSIHIPTKSLVLPLRVIYYFYHAFFLQAGPKTAYNFKNRLKQTQTINSAKNLT